MLRKANYALSFLGVTAAVSIASGQTINIDYADPQESTPSGVYSGAGSPGFWNRLYGEHGVPKALFRVEGTPIAATVTLLDGAGGPSVWSDDPATTYGDESLLDDYAPGGTDVVGRIRFDDLANDTYDVILYAWTPGSPDVLTAVWPDCDMLNDAILVGGSFSGELEEGITHARFTTTVTDGTLEICTAGGLTWDGAINGLQLVGTDCVIDGPDLCAFPPEVGPCDGICPMYFHNACTGHCELFYWGCCDGNDNKFDTLAECEAVCLGGPDPCRFENPPQADPGTPDLGFGTKNRYLSVKCNEADQAYALRVRSVSLPGYEYAEGREMWIQNPWAITESSGSAGPSPPPTFWAAGLGCEPVYTSWEVYGLVDVWDAAIVPGAAYEVQAIKQGCSPTSPYSYTEPLAVVTSHSCDVVGDCAVQPCTSPQGVVDFIDIAAIVDKFRNLPPALRKARADLTNANATIPSPDFIVDFADIGYCVDVFRGWSIPLPGPPVEDPCAGR